MVKLPSRRYFPLQLLFGNARKDGKFLLFPPQQSYAIHIFTTEWQWVYQVSQTCSYLN